MGRLGPGSGAAGDAQCPGFRHAQPFEGGYLPKIAIYRAVPRWPIRDSFRDGLDWVGFGWVGFGLGGFRVGFDLGSVG